MMVVATSPAVDVAAVDAFCKDLHSRILQHQQAVPDFDPVATSLRRLHSALKHLRVEVDDPDSLLNTDHPSINRNHLAPIVEECDFTLRQLEAILEKYASSTRITSKRHFCINPFLLNNSNSTLNSATSAPPVGSSTELDFRERDMLNLIQTKLLSHNDTIESFLNTVQLHNPYKSHNAQQTQQALVNADNNNINNLDIIKDKVDAVATRIFRDPSRNRDQLLDQDDLWQQFRAELEAEGFSKEVLHRNGVSSSLSLS